ncbi:MAG: class I adenylate-forming enzyme family protein [Acidimicrobiia bacterium]
MQSPDLLLNAATRFGERPCVIEGDRVLTFAEVDARADRLAGALLAGGLRRGDRVALLAGNVLEYLEVQVATMRAGLILVPLNFRLAVPELAYIVGDSRPRVLVHGPGHAEAAAALGVERTIHLGDAGTGEPYAEVLAQGEPWPAGTPRPRLDAEAANVILYTSGTTGRPKGAVISNGALMARLNMFAIEWGNRPGATFVQALPMFHIASHAAYSYTYVGATIVMVPEFRPAGVLELISRVRATHVMLVPTMINMVLDEPTLADADLSHLEMILYGASAIPPEVLRRALAAFGCGFLQIYGMTETAASSLLRPADHDPDRFPERLASAGTDSLGTETRVVDGDDVEVPPGELGEVVIRGPIVMDGYWNAPEATAEALRGGWMHTGDIGYRSTDGYLYISDRLKDMIVSGAENVYPREVEDVLYEHPAVADAAVIGVPDERWGERVHALVVTRAGVEVDLDALLAHCRSRLAGYKVPKTAELVDELPRNATGKVLRKDLRARYWAGHDRHVN